MSEAFFKVHSNLKREGPGETADIAWVASVIDLPKNARICDAACGPGADILDLLTFAPEGHVTAIDSHKDFIQEVHGRIGAHPQVTAFAGNYAKLKGPFDLIYCAGAVYFLGIQKALSAWRPCLAKGGAVAFSEPCFFVDTPSQSARTFWDGYPTLHADGIAEQVTKAGYQTLATRRISDAAWEIYYRSMEARIAYLRPTADEILSVALDTCEAEIALWRSNKDETGYLLSVVRPV